MVIKLGNKNCRIQYEFLHRSLFILYLSADTKYAINTQIYDLVSTFWYLFERKLHFFSFVYI